MTKLVQKPKIEVKEGLKLSEEEMIWELVKIKSGKQILQKLKVGLANLEIKVEDMQWTIDNSFSTTQKEAQKEMVKLQQLLKETKLSEDDDSIEGMPYIPQETKNNNSDSQSVTMDSIRDKDGESYKTTDATSQHNMSTDKKRKISKKESSSSKEDDNDDGYNAEEYDEQVMLMTGETDRKKGRRGERR